MFPDCCCLYRFGDVKTDSELIAEQARSATASNGGGALAGVTEMLNGCLCCVLVGQLKTALMEIKETYKPDRIIVETSGSAFPGWLNLTLLSISIEQH